MIGDAPGEPPSPAGRGRLVDQVRLRMATKIAAIPVIVALLMLSFHPVPNPWIITSPKLGASPRPLQRQ
jgi:hypothetical protein